MRKIKQIAGSDNRIYALCEDGTLWEINHTGEWTQHPGIPESEPTIIDGQYLAKSKIEETNKAQLEFEKEFISKNLKTFKGNVEKTAIHINVPEIYLKKRIIELGITDELSLDDFVNGSY